MLYDFRKTSDILSEANLTRKETGRKILNETGRFRVNWAHCIQSIGARSVRYG